MAPISIIMSKIIQQWIIFNNAQRIRGLGHKIRGANCLKYIFLAWHIWSNTGRVGRCPYLAIIKPEIAHTWVFPKCISNLRKMWIRGFGYFETSTEKGVHIEVVRVDDRE